MRVKNFTTETQRYRDKKDKKRKSFALHFSSKISVSLCLCGLIFLSVNVAAAQKIAVIAPEKTGHSAKFAAEMRDSLSAKFNVLDESLSETAFRSAAAEDSFNLSTDAAKAIGAAIGCEYFTLVKSKNQRRSTFEKKDFYESFAVVYSISARTGQLVFWKLQSFEAGNETDAEKLLFASADNLASEIFQKLKAARAKEITENAPRKVEEIPDENSPEAENFRPPLPFKRIKPEYTRLAYVYDVTATIDVLVDVGAGGEITSVEIARWAGFGLDESVAETVRKMNWRPAERNGKPLPMRVLLRYNFKRIEKEEF
jgi:TonB family protein